MSVPMPQAPAIPGQEAVKPNYVTFSISSVEDRAASQEEGFLVHQDAHMVHVHVVGGKTRNDYLVDDWFNRLVDRGDPFISHYRNMYEAWKQGQEIPEHGTPIKTWQGISPGAAQNCIQLNVRTLEDLAGVDEDTLRRLGPGARALKQRAIAWLETAEKHGQPAEELHQARTDLEAAQNTIEQHLETIQDLQGRIEEALGFSKNKKVNGILKGEVEE